MGQQALSTYARVNRADPTRTTPLRAAFVRAMRDRFLKLCALMRKAVIDEDCFGLTQGPIQRIPVYLAMHTPGYRAFAFESNPNKVRAFMKWLGKQEDSGILEVTHALQPGEGIESAWTNTYIQSAYQRGIQRGRQEMTRSGIRSRKGLRVPRLETTGGITAAFNNPFHADRLGALFTRTFSDLQGITNQMDVQISKILTKGIADGKNPRELGRLLTKTVTGPSGDLGITDALGRYIPAERRAETLARTEIIRAHHVATVQEYRNFGVLGVKVKAEWATAGDDRVCDQCDDLQGNVYTLDEIEGMIPLHPMCRCVALPVDVTEEE